MRPPSRFTAAKSWDGQKGDLSMSAFGLLCYLRVRQLSKQKAPTRAELLELVPLSQRTIEGGLSELHKAGLIDATQDKHQPTKAKKALAARQAGKMLGKAP